ncbi:hypothetical protein [Mycolicibacterium pulveris]|uniref:hypothetical protein n=1 Tax=Mycolicibacterium pulveris TaxID=36813 RepID=UPI003CFA5128
MRAQGLMTIAGLVAGLVLAPPAAADPIAHFREAIVSARSATPCAPLQYHPIVEQVAAVFNQMTDDYLNHEATRVQNKDTTPGSIPDPLPGLKNLGYGGTKAYLLQGAHHDEASAIKGALLEGYALNKISDCSYTDFGVDMRRNQSTAYNLAALVLAAP